MNREKEIKALHERGFVILRAAKNTNAPFGWKRKDGRWGYVDEMQDVELKVYKQSFSSALLAKSHCGFYLGHNDLCCIDLDIKKLDVPSTAIRLKDSIVKTLGSKVVVEKTKSNGYHIYFRYNKRLDNVPDWTKLNGGNWIELYYSKRFIACYLSNTNLYMLEHGDFALNHLTSREHLKLLSLLEPFKGKAEKISKRKKIFPIDKETWEQTESYIKQIEAQGLDITGDNPQWFKIGKAIASAYGEKGFEFFDRISQFSKLYNADTIKDDYTRFVNDDSKHNGTKITIATFFKMCEDAGLHDLRSLQVPAAHNGSKQFEVTLSKKHTVGEICHIVAVEFLKYMPLQCLDKVNLYSFNNTHWIKHGDITKELRYFIDNSTIDPKYVSKLHTYQYMDLLQKELCLMTRVDSIVPHTGNLYEDIYINMENGVLHVNVKNGKRKLLDHDPKYNFTTVLPFGYDALATCPRFDLWMNTQIPNKELHEIYYAFVASCLTKHKADIIMLLAGDTSTGKSSLIDVTRKIIGEENSAPISAGTLFSGTSDAQAVAMQMENKLLACDYDAQPFKHLELLLKVAAQEPIPGWQMHVARRPVVNYGRLIVAMNPYNYSVFNSAVARRFITINMDVPVVKDNSVMPEIYKEMEGIFNHVLNIGLKHLIINNGQIHSTDTMRRSTIDFQMQHRDAVRWFNLHYIIPAKGNKSKTDRRSYEEKIKDANKDMDIIFTDYTEMYAAYRIWCEDVEGIPVFKIQIKKHFVADLVLYGVLDEMVKINGIVRRGVFLGKKLAYSNILK